ncbi:ABC transporter substrate-binding protein [Paramaledivibacter caminithermalis]|jgi:iron complex transport system substrate-binding protein|uniref:Iron complex transport system substrate-binding protein n=1 Tax=Paramaledivibacter caminithermalis (strain DSM 15212 / CIP 107654 / DViRD3) TaxID=1121301 RepID=A0A1M6KV53_PARC5|nr:ABC transporter substrate-binding protein [Paramaledivibacter caminithermalis]SHJ62780.1 iron complex transport system substrate-binding protein [Paramaledivibacter caminithermalis DSM 15212]
MFHKKIAILICTLILVVSLGACTSNNQMVSSKDSQEAVNTEYEISFIDDMGEEIKLKEPCKRIISLYSAHTENLFSLGLDDEIIGVGKSDIYPVAALKKDVYDYKSDPEKVIAAQPDLVLIRPFINRKNPDFVETIKKTGITVVSLYPDSFEKFDDYILKLGKLTGKDERAEELLTEFYQNINNITEKTKDIEQKMTVYFESSENDYRTVTLDSMPAKAIEYAGGINIADDVKPIQEGSSIAPYGIEKILENADKIDVFISQRGVMNAGGNYHSIIIRPGFDAIKAVQNDRVYVINQKIISSPTFRYYKGVREIARMMYPEIFDNIEVYKSDDKITRREMAELIVKFTHKGIYVPTSKYYKKPHKGHTYGFFEDVKWTDKYYDYIETAVMSGYMEGFKEDNKEYFYPNKTVTRDEFAKILYLIGDFKANNKNTKILDLDKAQNQKIIQVLVDNNILECKDGYFKPNEEITCNEAVDILNKIKDIK